MTFLPAAFPPLGPDCTPPMHMGNGNAIWGGAKFALAYCDRRRNIA
jgi:hypothetical protein